MAENARQPRREQDQSWYKRWPRDEMSELSILRVDEYGTLQRYRDYSLIHGGIEDDEQTIFRIGATFQLTKYKVKKLWPLVEKFFTLREGRFFYEQDELERDSMFVISCKRQLAGKLGAAARWSDRNKVPEIATETAIANGMANGNSLPSNLDGKRGGEVEADTDTTRGVSPAAATTRGPDEAAAAAGPSPNVQSPPRTEQPLPTQDVTNPHHEPEQRAFLAVSARCAELGMPIPSPDLAHQVVKKFPDFPIEDVAKSLPRFPDQVSAALWLSKSAVEITMEAQRQQDSPGPAAKPTARDQHNKRMMDRAHELDRQRKAK
ncbi:MAG: hypothetical protein IVW54_16605 [Candidatus Binataceae bacterium]|nr:hypothetical protein [Candidatus Binataceae bacterium]